MDDEHWKLAVLMVIEYWLGKTDKTKANSSIELVIRVTAKAGSFMIERIQKWKNKN